MGWATMLSYVITERLGRGGGMAGGRGAVGRAEGLFGGVLSRCRVAHLGGLGGLARARGAWGASRAAAALGCVNGEVGFSVRLRVFCAGSHVRVTGPARGPQTDMMFVRP